MEAGNNSRSPLISVVTPIYGAAHSLEELCARLCVTLETLSPHFEIIMVNDHSPDESWAIMQALAGKDKRVRVLNLSRNFGQHAAITAGLDQVSGDWVVVMDCDLQDQPEEIPKLYRKALEGFDIVFGRRVNRQDSFLKRLGSKGFYAVYNFLTEADFDNSVANFSISRRSVIDVVISMRERCRSFPLFLLWVGYKVGYVDIIHAQRKTGKSSYSLLKLLHFATDSVVSQTNKPLRLSISVGLMLSLFAFVVGLSLIIKKISWGVPIEGWTSLMVTLTFFGGLILFNLGIVGIYLGKVYDEVKKRPLYVVKETRNL